MRIQNILLVPLFVSLYGCQPEAPAPKAAAPAAVEPSAAHTGQTAQPVAKEAAVSAPAQRIEPVSAEKAARPATGEKTAAAGKEKAPQPAVVEKPAPAQAVAAQVAKAEPAPAVAEARPEAKSGPAVSEADAMQLAKKNNCLACHTVDKKLVGPSFRDVAAKYRGDAGAEARLMDKIAKGGGGVWGAMAMPANPKISEADRGVLAKYVLSLK
jgi:cytochrome c